SRRKRTSATAFTGTSPSFVNRMRQGPRVVGASRRSETPGGPASFPWAEDASAAMLASPEGDPPEDRPPVRAPRAQRSHEESQRMARCSAPKRLEELEVRDRDREARLRDAHLDLLEQLAQRDAVVERHRSGARGGSFLAGSREDLTGGDEPAGARRTVVVQG